MDPDQNLYTKKTDSNISENKMVTNGGCLRPEKYFQYFWKRREYKMNWQGTPPEFLNLNTKKLK